MNTQNSGNIQSTWEPQETEKRQYEDFPFLYEAKKSLVTENELRYLRCIQESLSEEFLVFPQVNLAAFISRNDVHIYQNELYRNVDFLITDKNYAPLIAIEINDRTHETAERQRRDQKVANICEEAGIPLLFFWTTYGVNISYIQLKIQETLSSLPVKRIHHFMPDGILPLTSDNSEISSNQEITPNPHYRQSDYTMNSDLHEDGGVKTVKKKNKWVAILLWYICGLFGGHKFYEGKVVGGVLRFIAFIFVGVWSVPLSEVWDLSIVPNYIEEPEIFIRWVLYILWLTIVVVVWFVDLIRLLRKPTRYTVT